MSLRITRWITGVLFLGIIAGCTSTRYEVKSYIKDEKRVDQQLESGNQGYFQGTPADVGERKQTRKVFVVEVVKPAPAANPEIEKILEESMSVRTVTVADSVKEQRQESYMPPKINIPPLDQVQVDSTRAPLADSEIEYVEYIVEKDDTLQKVSKKFYDNYSQWPLIYEANKDAIKNPDFLKPGITIQIPVQK